MRKRKKERKKKNKTCNTMLHLLFSKKRELFYVGERGWGTEV
jgi:hypothetical protein